MNGGGSERVGPPPALQQPGSYFTPSLTPDQFDDGAVARLKARVEAQQSWIEQLVQQLQHPHLCCCLRRRFLPRTSSSGTAESFVRIPIS